MRYTPLATDALCPMPARSPHVTEKGYRYHIIRLMKIFLVAPEKRELAKNLKIPAQ